MPYNTNAIPPRKEPTGQAQLPVTRVRKIISVDPDVAVCSNNAAFVITLATELFIQYLASEAQNMVKLDRKPRRNVQYRDLASAVQRVDRLEFLEDVAPQTVSFGKVKGEAAAAQAKLKDGAAATGKSRGASGNGSGGGGGGGGGGGAGRSASDRKSSTGAPTAISALTNGGPAPSPSSGGRQQKLPFNILNGSSSSTSGATFRGSRGSVEGSGVAAATALAHAAAASGSLDGDDGPDAQLEQDMLRMQDHGDSSNANNNTTPSRGPGGGNRYSNGDVDMTDS